MKALLWLWRHDPETRHFCRLMCFPPYALWVMRELDAPRAPLEVALLFVPMVVHGLWCWLRYRADLRRFIAGGGVL